MRIEPAYAALDDVRSLFNEYAHSLNVDLCFQSFEKELAGLPGRYALPDGRLYVAYEDSVAVGCVALRSLGGGVCEMKRLYVKPEFRRSGLGESLARKIISEAALMDYKRIVLDTLESMESAVKLYKKLGFHVIPPYYENPIPDAVYLGLDLKKVATSKSEAE